MRKKRFLFLIVVFIILGIFARADAHAGEKLTVSTESWSRATNQNGTGVYFDLLRKIYEPQGYDLEFHIKPYKRAVMDTQNGKSDMWIASYKNEVDHAVYPKHHFDVDPVQALCPAGKLPLDNPFKSLKGKKLGWVRGYEYQKFLPFKVEYRELNSRSSIIKLINSGHLDCMLDADVEIKDVLKKHPELRRNNITFPILHLPLYFAFSETPKGQKLADLFDRSFPVLFANGTVEQIFKSWKLPFLKDKINPIPHSEG